MLEKALKLRDAQVKKLKAGGAVESPVEKTETTGKDRPEMRTYITDDDSYAKLASTRETA